MKKVLFTNPVLKMPRKKKKPTLKDVFFLKGTHKMSDGTVMSGKTHSKNSRVVKKAPASKGRKAKRNRKSKY